MRPRGGAGPVPTKSGEVGMRPRLIRANGAGTQPTRRARRVGWVPEPTARVARSAGCPLDFRLWISDFGFSNPQSIIRNPKSREDGAPQDQVINKGDRNRGAFRCPCWAEGGRRGSRKETTQGERGKDESTQILQFNHQSRQRRDKTPRKSSRQTQPSAGLGIEEPRASERPGLARKSPCP